MTKPKHGTTMLRLFFKVKAIAFRLSERTLIHGIILPSSPSDQFESFAEKAKEDRVILLPPLYIRPS